MATQAPSVARRAPIHPGTTIGTVRLTVSDLRRSRDFYERALGLNAVAAGDGSLALAAGRGRPLIELRGEPGAPPLDRRRAGLYHLALLLPSRIDLAGALARLAAAGWPLEGASDHMVSEALYLSDPDGNGIELYRDRPRAEWQRSAGGVAMATLPLDLRELVGELSGGDAKPPAGSMPAGTRIGHVHLQVAELGAAEAFYGGVLGFQVTVRSYPGALFLSAGGYHHHLGLNIWQSAGAQPPEPGAVGLRSFEVLLPDAAALEAVLERVRVAGLPLQPLSHGAAVRDPSGNLVLLTAG